MSLHSFEVVPVLHCFFAFNEGIDLVNHIAAVSFVTGVRH